MNTEHKPTLRKPTTPTGIEFLHSLTTDSQPGRVRRRPVAEWIATIEAEARSAALTEAEERIRLDVGIGRRAALQSLARLKAERVDVIHLVPPKGSSDLPCCGVLAFERMGDRMTTDPQAVTCKGGAK